MVFCMIHMFVGGSVEAWATRLSCMTGQQRAKRSRNEPGMLPCADGHNNPETNETRYLWRWNALRTRNNRTFLLPSSGVSALRRYLNLADLYNEYTSSFEWSAEKQVIYLSWSTQVRLLRVTRTLIASLVIWCRVIVSASRTPSQIACWCKIE